MMPLYNNILLSKKNQNDTSTSANTATTTSNTTTTTTTNVSSKSNGNQTSSASMKFLQDHLQSKRRSQQQIIGPTKIQKSNKTNENKIISDANLHGFINENDWNPEDEYDPMLPNSYEILQLEYLKAKEQKMLEQQQNRATVSSLKKTIPNLLEVLDKLDNDSDDEYASDLIISKRNRSNISSGISIAPPTSLAINQNDNSPVNKSTVDRRDENKKLNNPAVSVAEKIMLKMGYKAGQGLGKDEQGISSPIEVQRSGIDTCKIITQDQNQKKPPTINDSNQNNIKKLLMDSTRILLLQNMVGPGEVDDDLESETKEECKKYGDVVKCLIYEIPNKKVPDDQAVRIFVEFNQVESAIKAVSDLNGRYFGGRIVKASFYNLERFNKLDLGPERPK